MPSGLGRRSDADPEAVVEVGKALLDLRLRARGALLLALVGLHARRAFAAVEIGLLLALLEVDLEVAPAGEPAALVVGLGALPALLLGGDALARAGGVGVEAALEVDLEMRPAALRLGPDAG